MRFSSVQRAFIAPDKKAVKFSGTCKYFDFVCAFFCLRKNENYQNATIPIVSAYALRLRNIFFSGTKDKKNAV